MLTTLIAGTWMMVVRWGPEPWIVSAIIAFIAVMVIAIVFTIRRLHRLGSALGSERDPALSALAYRPLRQPQLAQVARP